MPSKILKKSFSQMNNNLLHSRYVLYFIFVIALGKFFFLLNSGDYYYASIFVLVGLLTSFFNKNMIVILFLALSLTSILELGSNSAVHEGFKDENEEEGFEHEEEGFEHEEEGFDDEEHEGFDDEEHEGFDDEEEGFEGFEGFEDEEEGFEGFEDKEEEGFEEEEGMENGEGDVSSLEKNIEGLKQVKDNIYSDLQDMNKKSVKHLDVDKNMKDTDKLLVAQDKLLHNMDKYKSLLDTLQGITQNMSILKSSA